MLLSKYDSDLDHNQINVKLHSLWWRDLSKSCGEGEDVGWFQGALWWKVGGGAQD